MAPADTPSDELLRRLNDRQREAVLHGDGPLLILAGAGSGKTRVLTHRVAHLVRARGLSPHAILAFTFTNKAAREMKQRIIGLIGDVPGLWVGTFHAICLRILRTNAELVGRTPGFSVYDADDQEALVKSCLKAFELSDREYRPRVVQSQLSRAKNNLVDHEAFEAAAATNFDRTLARLYREYDRRLVARLCYPVANPNLGFEFCKGYYARVTDRLHGRVTRLFMTPLVRSMLSLSPNQPFLRYLDSFRYPLAGEFAMRAELARETRIPGDWGLEVGMLAEIYRNRSNMRICQVDLTQNYEHKHQALSEEDPSKGLMRMTNDIAKTLFRTLASEGIIFTEGFFEALEVRYVRMAEDTIAGYYADAQLNGLEFDRHAEEQAVAAFARSVRSAAQSYLEDPLGKPLIPNWNRIVSAIPNFFELLLKAVHADNDVRLRRVA